MKHSSFTMTWPERSGLPLCAMRTVAALLLASAALGAQAQPHEARSDGWILRGSTVASDRIDSTAAKRHGIEPSSTRGVLNVVLLKPKSASSAEVTVPGKVTASMRNLAGVQLDIEMREVRVNGWITYMGTYEFLPREVIDFRIQAIPAGRSGPPITLRFRDRMWMR